MFLNYSLPSGGALSLAEADHASTGVEMYTESTGSFQNVAGLSQAISGSCAAVVQGIVINIGGYDGIQDYTVS